MGQKYSRDQLRAWAGTALQACHARDPRWFELVRRLSERTGLNELQIHWQILLMAA